MTRVLGVDDASMREAARLLAEGELVAFPTETVYGLGARADRSEAVRAIYVAKGRPQTNPLIVHVADVAAARALSSSWTDTAERLARAFWPGPLTLVVARGGSIAGEVSAGGDTIAVRVPSHPVASKLLAACALPIAAPSANRSTTVSPVEAAHVLKTLEGRIAAVVDGGRTGFGIESTIVDARGGEAVLLRAGAVERDAIARLVGVVDKSAEVDRGDRAAASPGRQEKHYAPRAKVMVVVPSCVASALEDVRARGERAGAVLVEGRSAPRYASEFYAALHRLDDDGAHVIVIEEVPGGAEWEAVRDRIRRAAAP